MTNNSTVVTVPKLAIVVPLTEFLPNTIVHIIVAILYNYHLIYLKYQLNYLLMTFY